MTSQRLVPLANFRGSRVNQPKKNNDLALDLLLQILFFFPELHHGALLLPSLALLSAPDLALFGEVLQPNLLKMDAQSPPAVAHCPKMLNTNGNVYTDTPALYRIT